jgi:anti-sigma factor RsiW
MDHSEAVQQMAAERYLLDELPPDLRDEFEEHVFDCSECAMDLRAGAAFVEEAKAQLPGLIAQDAPGPARESPAASKASKVPWWKSLFANPLIAGPVFAALLVVIGYQNLIMYPALRSEATEPRLSPAVTLHAGVRGSAGAAINANSKQGVTLLIDVPDVTGYASFSFDLYDPQGKLVWSHGMPSAEQAAADNGSLSLDLPGAGLRQGTYALVVSGVTAGGEHREVERESFNIQLHD